MRNFLSALFFSLIVGGAWGQQVVVTEYSGTTIVTSGQLYTVSKDVNAPNKINIQFAQGIGSTGRYGFVASYKPLNTGASNLNVLLTNTTCLAKFESTNPSVFSSGANFLLSEYASTTDPTFSVSSSSTSLLLGSSGSINKLVATSVVYIYAYNRSAASGTYLISNKYVKVELPPEDITDDINNDVVIQKKICPNTTIENFFANPQDFSMPFPRSYSWNGNTTTCKLHQFDGSTYNESTMNEMLTTSSYSFIQKRVETTYSTFTPTSTSVIVPNQSYSGNSLYSCELTDVAITGEYILPSIVSQPSNVKFISHNASTQLESAVAGDLYFLEWFTSLDNSSTTTGDDVSQGQPISYITNSPASLPNNLELLPYIVPINDSLNYYFKIYSWCDEVITSNMVKVFRLPTPDLTGYNNQSVCSSTQINQLSNPGTVTLNGRDYTWAFFTDENATTPFVGTDIAQTGTYVIRFKLVESGQTYFSDTYSTLNVTVLPSGSWTGAAGTTLVNGVQAYDLNDANNWCGGIVPQTPTIPENTTVYLDGSYDFTNLTVECGGSLIITETGRVNITNVLTNDGLVHVINGGTIHYGSTVSGTCTGTYEITETFSPSRYWYVGPTTTNTVRADFGTIASTQNPTGTQMWSWNELANNTANNYTAPVYDNGNLIPGNGYVYRNLGGTNLEVNVTGPYITSAISRTGLTRTGTGTLAGYHLLSNPYTAYLDLTDVFAAANTGTSNMLPTVWVRSNSASNGNAASMVFDTYNAQSGIGTGLGWQTAALNGNPGGINSLMRWVAPMQGFWVRVNTGGSTGNIAFDYSMASANPVGAGQLRTTSPIEALARINVQFGDQKDQFIAALSPSAQNGFDAFDSEKMFTSGVVQAYTPNSGKKLVINTLKNNKSKVSMPVTVECPANGWYSFELLELQLEAGVLLLEDKLEGVMHDLTLDTSYQFYANSGVLSNRFVLHFNIPLATSNPTGPSSIEDLVSESHNAQIEINANSTGKVTVELSQANESTSSFVRIVDINGKVLESFTGDGLSFDFQISQGQGIYIVEVSNGLSTEKKKVFIQ